MITYSGQVVEWLERISLPFLIYPLSNKGVYASKEIFKKKDMITYCSGKISF